MNIETDGPFKVSTPDPIQQMSTIGIRVSELSDLFDAADTLLLEINDIEHTEEGSVDRKRAMLGRLLSMASILKREMAGAAQLITDLEVEYLQAGRSSRAAPDYRKLEWEYVSTRLNDAKAEDRAQRRRELYHQRVPDLDALREKVRIARFAGDLDIIDVIFTQLLADIDHLN